MTPTALEGGLERAIAIAAEGHAGQLDKAGEPYILHPLRVMLNCATSDERIVAVLHDVVEDCPGWTFDRLRREGFSDAVLAVERAAANPAGRRVKLADLRDNCLMSRISAPTERDFARIEKYRGAIAFIENGL